MARISINISSSSIDSMENKGNVLTVLTPRSTETLRSPENSDLIKQRKKKFTGYVANLLFSMVLTFRALYISESGIKIKINFKFLYSHLFMVPQNVL